MLLISCEVISSKTTEITVLSDRTDPVIPKPRLDDIYPLLDLETNPNTGIEFNFQNIGNVDYSPIYQKHLKASSLLDNTLQRSADIKRFYVALDTMIALENNKVYNYSSSSVIVPLITQLKALRVSKSTKKIIVLYSDLAEFSDIYNVYDYTSNLGLQKQPLVVAEHFKSKLAIPKLDNVSLYIVYYPKTTTQNQLFQNMIRVYKEVFKESGLHIQIGLRQYISSDE